MDFEVWENPATGRSPVGDFIENQENNVQVDIYDKLELYEKYSFQFLQQSEHIKPFKFKSFTLWEIRFILRKIKYRIFSIIIKDTFFLIHAFIKKSPKTPKKEIKVAEERAKYILNG